MKDTVNKLNSLAHELNENVQDLHKPFSGMILTEDEKIEMGEEERQAKYVNDDRLGII